MKKQTLRWNILCCTVMYTSIIHVDLRVLLLKGADCTFKTVYMSQKLPTKFKHLLLYKHSNTYTKAYTDLLLHVSIHRHSAEGWMYQQGPDDGTLLSVPGCWMPPLRAPTAWCIWPHFNDLNHLRSTATHFRGLTEFILVDRDQCPQPWTLPDYSRARDLSDWHDWIQLSALILLLIPPLWLWPWGQMSGMERWR